MHSKDADAGHVAHIFLNVLDKALFPAAMLVFLSASTRARVVAPNLLRWYCFSAFFLKGLCGCVPLEKKSWNVVRHIVEDVSGIPICFFLGGIKW